MLRLPHSLIPVAPAGAAALPALAGPSAPTARQTRIGIRPLGTIRATRDGNFLPVAGQFSAVLPFRYMNKRVPEPRNVSRRKEGKFDVRVPPVAD